MIHLTEHHGDSTPGSAIRVEIQNIEEFHKELASKNYAYARPGLEETPWKTREIRVGDPFHNHLLFYEFTNES
ncbi:glyoxalase superfamily protein [Bacillus horti]|uniref:glyoxalase superfamily protein n=1 Tax=Caldalkalibacillus horti TaxID=77523 RepID=UPI0031D4CB02